ncbi:MAG: carbohydrate binding family 9 domain-containing protein [candidate division KSB1 bacterium]|nr:carbohydrate binding family 9 domain-containing protein [candidate division KSB1 bacterium]
MLCTLSPKPLPLLPISLLALVGTGWGAVSPLVSRGIQTLHCPRIDQAPVLDGRLDDEAWKKAASVSGFTLTGSQGPRPARHQTTAYLAYDEENLYLGFVCLEPSPASMQRNYQPWEAWDQEAIFWDDRIEIFLDVDHNHRSYHHFVLNPNGVQFDQQCFRRIPGSRTCDFDVSWNGFWRARTSLGDSAWIAEIAIAFSSFGLAEPPRGTTWGINLCRVRQPAPKRPEYFEPAVPEPAYPTEYSAWVYVFDSIRESPGHFHEPIQFGDLVFGETGVWVHEIAFPDAQDSYGPMDSPSLFGTNPLRLRISAGEEALRRIRIAASTLSPSGRASTDWQTVEIRAGDTATVEMAYRIWEDGENRLSINLLAFDSGEILYGSTYVVRVPPFVEFDLEPFYSRRIRTRPVQLRLRVGGDIWQGARLRLSLFREGLSVPLLETCLADLEPFRQMGPAFSIDSLRNLPEGPYRIECNLLDQHGRSLGRFAQRFTKIDPAIPDTFAVISGPYSYGGSVDEAVQLLFPHLPARFVFWRGASYVPWWDLDQAAYSYEFVEAWGGGGQGCCGPMQDKDCRHSQVEVLEATEARAVVRWRYALSDPHDRIYYNEWVDEYYTFYPDGVGVREVQLWANRSARHEVSEAILVNPPGVQPRQLYEEKFCTLGNLKGEEYSNTQLSRDPELYRRILVEWQDFLFQVHFRERPKPFLVFSLRSELLPGVRPETITIGSQVIEDYGQRGHWPVNKWRIDGFNAVGLDRPYHGSIGYIQADVDCERYPTVWLMLVGTDTTRTGQIASASARSWLDPPPLTCLQGLQCTGYSHRERAYMLQANPRRESDSWEGSVILLASPERPAFNPVFRIRGWSAPCTHVRLNGRDLQIDAFRSALTPEGDCILFLKGILRQKTRIDFGSARRISDFGADGDSQ